MYSPHTLLPKMVKFASSWLVLYFSWRWRPIGKFCWDMEWVGIWSIPFDLIYRTPWTNNRIHCNLSALSLVVYAIKIKVYKLIKFHSIEVLNSNLNIYWDLFDNLHIGPSSYAFSTTYWSFSCVWDPIFTHLTAL